MTEAQDTPAPRSRTRMRYWILLLIFLAYAASGPIQYLLRLRRRKPVE